MSVKENKVAPRPSGDAGLLPVHSPSTGETPVAQGRVLSIDALRGFDMFWIIGGAEVVKVIAGLFANPLPKVMVTQMEHVKWEGFATWDLIMPLFLFIVGAAMPFSLGKRLEAGQGRWAIYRKVLLRTVILFVLGMAAQGHLLEFKLDQLHIYCNTLQAIAAGYLVAAVLMLHLPVLLQLLATAGLLAGYWALLVFVPIPGQGAGHLATDLNLAMYVDQLLLRGFQDQTNYTWILSSLTFAATVMLGVLGGHLLHSRQAPWAKFLGLLAAGGVCLAAGWFWGYKFPWIKHLWTSSMVLWAAGWSYLLLALFYLVIDVAGLRRWAFFFVVIGSNAILAYMLAEVNHLGGFTHFTDPWVAGLAAHLGRYDGPLRTVCGFMLLWGILYYLYRKGTFIRV
jgi:predicted acyltransferase